jgi:hypothetical protein
MLQGADDSLRFTLEAEILPLASNRPRTVRALASKFDKQAKKIPSAENQASRSIARA